MSVIDDPREQPFPAASPTVRWRRRRAQLTARINEAVQQARVLIGPDLEVEPLDASDPGRATEVITSLTWLAIERLREQRPGRTATTGMCELICDLQTLSLELHDHDMASRTRRIAAVETGLASLRAITSTADLLDRVCKELVRSGGFERALLSRVEDNMWSPWVGHFTDAMPGWFDSWIDTRIPLGEMVLETTLLTEHRPSLVHDVNAPEVHQIVRDGLSGSYVVAPVMPAGNVVGFIHADHQVSGRRCDEADRDVLWAFAEGFGHIYERTVLLEGVRAQRSELRDLMSEVDTAMQQLCESEIELASQPSAGSSVTRTAVSVLTTMSSKMEELTPREAEVLTLMVAGAKNGAIAEKLVITEGTVKSHVKHILRKLGAVNRSQAIAHYLGVSHEDLN